MIATDPEEERYQNVIMLDKRGYKAVDQNVIEYGKQCIDIFESRIAISV